VEPWWLVAAGVGVVILSASIGGARSGVGAREVRIFRALNHLPGGCYWFVWVPMQLGNFMVGMVAGLLVAVAVGSWVVALGVVVAAVLKVVVERILKTRFADQLVQRERPGTSQPGAILRGDVPSSGLSFPSGHVILVTAVTCVIAHQLPVSWWCVALLVILLGMVGRVYVGAHNPLDVTAGLGTGLLIGGVVACFAA
jgi:undecaprenyl-diphosphatase